MKRTLVLQYAVTAGLLVAAFNNCSKAQFSAEATDSTVNQSSTTPQSPPPAQTSSPHSKIYQTTLSPSSNTAPLDMIWVIDNSGSMSDTVAEVNRNFSNFLASISSISNLKIALISKQGTSGTAMTLPISNSNQLQINESVGSNNGLDLLTTALGQTTLSSFLRPNAKKVIVIVTDDQSDMTAANFQTKMQTLLPNQAFAFFGFVGLGAAQSSCEARQGTIYSSLATANGGQVFNVCDQDWSSSFSKLENNIVGIVAANKVTISDSVSQVLSITLNGVSLGASDYTIAGNVITIDPAVISGSASVAVSVTYLP